MTDLPIGQFHHATALAEAERIQTILSPFCESMLIAGSLRRLSNTVKDIELVAKPQMVEKPPDSYFDEKKVYWRNPEFVRQVLSLGEIVQGDPSVGRHIKIKLSLGIQLDLFIPEENDFFRQFVIRTGSADWIRKYVATAWMKLGWVGTGNTGLRRLSDCRQSFYNGKPYWKIINTNGELPPAWSSEQDFFDWLKVKNIPPNERNV